MFLPLTLSRKGRESFRLQNEALDLRESLLTRLGKTYFEQTSMHIFA